MISHLFFDFFGTLVQYSAGLDRKGFARTMTWLTAHGFHGDELLFRQKWKGIFDALTAASEDSGDEFSMEMAASNFFALTSIHGSEEEFVSTYLEDWNQGVTYLPSVADMVGRLASRYKLAVVSNTHYEPLVLGHLEGCGVLPHLEFVLTSVAFGKRKPHPAIFNHALAAASVQRDQVLYIGDSYTDDYQGAQKAGIRCLLIDPSAHHPIVEADRISSIFELEQALATVS